MYQEVMGQEVMGQEGTDQEAMDQEEKGREVVDQEVMDQQFICQEVMGQEVTDQEAKVVKDILEMSTQTSKGEMDTITVRIRKTPEKVHSLVFTLTPDIHNHPLCRHQHFHP